MRRIRMYPSSVRQFCCPRPLRGYDWLSPWLHCVILYTSNRFNKKKTYLPLETECGSALERTFNKRIFNGVDAELGYWPWMAALIDKKQGLFCGGTLVKDQFILTAAHCVKYFLKISKLLTGSEPFLHLILQESRSQGTNRLARTHKVIETK